ncbi:EF-hand calcium-binding domain-containing protein 6 [Chelmon rostratus]|uniref:EF-hand calcium-binding domain-containing protein 6 n=1 Tax=Chelmon rostratus TaxID=109905 RepID=UPI001BE97E14|nr:EF-hand calcium-binding domain-containing protein 6 [Chelmon rostratus]
MAKLLPPHRGLGLGPRPHTAPIPTTHLFRGRQTGEVPGKTWIQTHRVHPVTNHPLTLDKVEPLIHGSLAQIKSAFIAVDPDGTGLVSKEEFRRVLEGLLCISQNQLDTLVHKVCERSGEAVDYMQFLRSFRQAPAARRACSRGGSASSLRRGPQNASMSLCDMQKHLKDKIGGNLTTVIRALRLFDYNREGHIQQHEFRRILDNYCIHLTDKEFQRLWNHYSPRNMSTISYEHFLEELGFGDSHDFRIAPVCTKLEPSSRGTTPPETIKQRTQRPGSLSSSSVLPHRKLQSLFYDKMCMNSTPVWQALQAFDTTHSGLVEQDVLRAVLSSFMFPMNPHSFQKLTSRYGVRATGPVRWKHFLGHFTSPLKEEGAADLPPERAFQQPSPDDLHVQSIYPRLKDILHLLDTKEADCFTRADLRHLLEKAGGTQPRNTRARLLPSQITELLNALDPEHTGVIPMANLERLNPNISSAPSAAPPPSPANTAEPLDVPEMAEHTALSSVLAALALCDPQRTGYVTQEDLRKVLSCYGMPITDTHFSKLCETSSSRHGNSSELVCYTGFLRNLGVPLAHETHTSSSHKESYRNDRPRTSRLSSPQSVKGQRPPSSLRVGPDTCNILDIIFQRMRLRLEQRHTSLTDRIQAVTHSSDGTLSEADLRKVLEDSWVMLDERNFSRFTELLGVRNGQIESSAFLTKYEEAIARGGQQASEGHGEKDEVDPQLMSAEQCLAAMKTRIRTIHGDNLTAFRLMDRKRKGVVDCHDFRLLYNSLGFFCGEEEYQRLLDLTGLRPGGNLNYAEFVDVVENNGKRKQGTQRASVQEQLHELLARDARYKWTDMSKVLCQFDADGHGWIQKQSLRRLLFTYALPLRSDEFDQLWSRYDPEWRGCVAVCDFLEKLGFHHEEQIRPQSRKLNRSVAQQDTDRPVSSDAASPECSHPDLLLLSLLQVFLGDPEAFPEYQLNVSTGENCKRLSYMDFLSSFDHKAEKKKHEPPPVSPDAVRQIESLDSLSPGMALARMRELVTASAPNLYKAFLAFDRSGTGTVKALEFRQVLHNFCARLSDKQHRYMLTKLELDCENCTVNWKDFLNKFQSQSAVVNVSSRYLTRIMGQMTKTRSPIQTKTSETTEQLQQIQKGFSCHLYEITKELVGLDPSNSTSVSKEQFRQLCDCHCLRLINDQFERVWSQMPANEQRKLQCREPLKRAGALDETPHTEAASPSPEPRDTKSCCPDIAGATLQRTKSAPQCTSRRPASVGRPGTGSPLGSVERRLRGAVQRCWREIQRNCTKEDPQQEGHISAASFLDILRSLGIDLTREQLVQLAVKFDIMNNGCVSYHNFLRHFLLNLKPAEAKRAFERRELPLPVTTSQGVLSKDCVKVMLRIYGVVRSSWTSVRRRFLTADRTRAGTVSVQDFRKVLRHFSVHLSEEEFFHLSSYFDANTTGKICYNSFLWAFLH